MSLTSAGPIRAIKTQRRLLLAVEARLEQRGDTDGYRRDVFWEWLRQWAERVGIFVLGLVFAAAVPFTVTMTFAHGWIVSSKAAGVHSTPLMLSLHSALYTGITILIATRPRYGIYWPLETVVLTFFAQTDRQLLRRGIRGCLLVMLGATYPVAVVYGVVALKHQFGWQGWSAAMGLAVVHGLTLASIGMLGMAKVPSTPLVHRVAIGVGVILLLLVMLSSAFAGMAHVELDAMPRPFTMFPPGWVDAVLFFGVLRGQSEAFWLLLPCLAVMVACGLWVRRADIDKQPLLNAVMEGADTPAKLSMLLTSFMNKPERGAVRNQSIEDAPKDPAIAIRLGLDTDGDWRRQGWIGRVLSWVLSARERRTYTAWMGGLPAWRLRAGLLLLGLAAAQLTLLIPSLRFARPSPIPIAIAVMFFVSTLTRRGPLSMYPRNGLIAHYPVGITEIVFCVLKVNTMWSLVFLPVVLACAALHGFVGQYPAMMMLGRFVAPVFLYLMVSAVAAPSLLVLGGNWVWSMGLGLAYSVHVMLALACAGAIVFGSLPIVIAGYTGCLLGTFSFVTLQTSLLKSSHIDIRLDAAKKQVEGMGGKL